MNLHQKIVEIRKSIKGFNKDTKAYNFQYVSGNQILRMIKEKMDELNVLLIPCVDYDTLHWEKHEYKNAKDQDKLDFIVQARLVYKWVNADDTTDFLEIPWLMLGQQADDVAKAVGTSLTYNERYFLLKFFGLPTDEDDSDARDVDYGGKSKKETNKSNNKFDNKSNNSNPKLISEPQVKRLYMLGKGKETGVIKELLKAYGYESAKEITVYDYNEICSAVENL